MKSLLLALVAYASLSAHATVDGLDRVWIVVQNIQEESDFSLERGPLVGCYGLPQGPRLEAFVLPYNVPANIGCGGVATTENINALSCATIVDAKESKDYNSFSDITLDISKCAYKNNKRFITLVRTAAARNFPQTNGKEVRLTLKK